MCYNSIIKNEWKYKYNMTKKKVYAVRKGKQTGIFDTWEECKRATYGYSGAVYKSFATRQEADAYLNEGKALDCVNHTNHTNHTASADSNPGTNALIAYVDGSFNKKIGRYSFGCILLPPDGTIIKESGSGSESESLALRNVAGEILGAMFAVKWAIKNGYPAIDIRYDYSGIEQWATHGWQAKNDLTKNYAAFMDDCREHILITFTKIAAHTGDLYNEAADQLAKEALR